MPWVSAVLPAPSGTRQHDQVPGAQQPGQLGAERPGVLDGGQRAGPHADGHPAHQVGDRGGHLVGVLEQHQVPGVRDDPVPDVARPGSGQRGDDPVAVPLRDELVGVAGEHQHGDGRQRLQRRRRVQPDEGRVELGDDLDRGAADHRVHVGHQPRVDVVPGERQRPGGPADHVGGRAPDELRPARAVPHHVPGDREHRGPQPGDHPRQPEVQVVQAAGRGGHQRRADHPGAEQPRPAGGQLQQRHAAHRVPDQHDRPARHPGVQHRHQVVGQLVDGGAVGVPAGGGPVPALVVEDQSGLRGVAVAGGQRPAQVAALERPRGHRQGVAVHEDDGQRGVLGADLLHVQQHAVGGVHQLGAVGGPAAGAQRVVGPLHRGRPVDGLGRVDLRQRRHDGRRAHPLGPDPGRRRPGGRHAHRGPGRGDPQHTAEDADGPRRRVRSPHAGTPAVPV